MKIVHMTTVHPRNDVRVLHKQCQTLASAGHEVSLLVADGEGDAQAGRVRIIDIGRRASRRLKRALVTGAAMYRAARRIGADVYHFHDPELLPWAALLRLGGQRVVYDAHEHLADDIMAKPYLSPRQKRLFGFTVAPLERFLAGRMSAVIGATPSIVARFEGRAPRTVGVFNFPLEEEMKGAPGPIAGRQRQCPVGVGNRLGPLARTRLRPRQPAERPRLIVRRGEHAGLRQRGGAEGAPGLGSLPRRSRRCLCRLTVGHDRSLCGE